MRATEATITFSSLKQGISTLTSGPVSGSSIGGVAARRAEAVPERQDGQEDQPRDAQHDGDDEQRLHARSFT